MKDISKLSVELGFEFDELLPKLKQAHDKSCDKIWDEIVNTAPMVSGGYVSSITRGETEETRDGFSTEIYSDLKVGGNDPKWSNVPLACLVNWGTGPLGESSNIYPHGYGYTTDAPWNFIAQMQYEQTGTWGMKANPHFYLALSNNVDEYMKNLMEVVK